MFTDALVAFIFNLIWKETHRNKQLLLTPGDISNGQSSLAWFISRPLSHFMLSEISWLLQNLLITWVLISLDWLSIQHCRPQCLVCDCTSHLFTGELTNWFFLIQLSFSSFHHFLKCFWSTFWIWIFPSWFVCFCFVNYLTQYAILKLEFLKIRIKMWFLYV